MYGLWWLYINMLGRQFTTHIQHSPPEHTATTWRVHATAQRDKLVHALRKMHARLPARRQYPQHCS